MKYIIVVIIFIIIHLQPAESQELDSIPNLKSVPYHSPSPPPEWALLQRQMMEALYPAAMEFVEKS